MDSLVDEKDRSTQKRGETTGRAGGTGGHGSAHSTSDGSSQLSLEISVSRPAEIEAALQQFVSPKVISFFDGRIDFSVSMCGMSRTYIPGKVQPYRAEAGASLRVFELTNILLVCACFISFSFRV